MKAQRCILQIIWCDFIRPTNDQTKRDLPLVIADRRNAILCHIILLSEKHRLIPCYSMLSTTRKDVTLKQAGSVHQVDNGKTLLQQVIADQDCDMDVIWSQAQDRATWRSLRRSLDRLSSD